MLSGLPDTGAVAFDSKSSPKLPSLGTHAKSRYHPIILAEHGSKLLKEQKLHIPLATKMGLKALLWTSSPLSLATTP